MNLFYKLLPISIQSLWLKYATVINELYIYILYSWHDSMNNISSFDLFFDLIIPVAIL